MPRISTAAGPVLTALVLAAGCPASAEEMNIPELRNMVIQDCGSCHGLTLKGGLGSPLLPSNIEHLDRETLEEIILDGLPDTAMPPWRGLLNEDQAAWIAKALKTGTLLNGEEE